MLCRSLLTVSVGLLFSANTVAQDLATGEFRARVTTKGGNHIRGILEEVTDEHLYVDHMNSGSHHGIEKIPLTVISKVALRSNRRRHTLEGAVVGGGLASFVTIQSSKKMGFVVRLSTASI